MDMAHLPFLTFNKVQGKICNKTTALYLAHVIRRRGQVLICCEN